jgi:hypothetical protein
VLLPYSCDPFASRMALVCMGYDPLEGRKASSRSHSVRTGKGLVVLDSPVDILALQVLPFQALEFVHSGSPIFDHQVDL